MVPTMGVAQKEGIRIGPVGEEINIGGTCHLVTQLCIPNVSLESGHFVQYQRVVPSSRWPLSCHTPPLECLTVTSDLELSNDHGPVTWNSPGNPADITGLSP